VALREVPRFTATDGYILAVDPATKSGWAYFHGSQYFGSGTITSAKGRHEIVRIWAERSAGQPRVAVVETWGPHWKSHTALARTAENRGRWLEHLALLDIPVVGVKPETWRSRLLGKYGNARTKQFKELALTHASARIKRTITQDDEAEAILIGIWATYATEVVTAMYPDLETTDSKTKRALTLK
jgi:hypothetical protein